MIKTYTYIPTGEQYLAPRCWNFTPEHWFCSCLSCSIESYAHFSQSGCNVNVLCQACRCAQQFSEYNVISTKLDRWICSWVSHKPQLINLEGEIVWFCERCYAFACAEQLPVQIYTHKDGIYR